MPMSACSCTFLECASGFLYSWPPTGISPSVKLKTQHNTIMKKLWTHWDLTLGETENTTQYNHEKVVDTLGSRPR
ncbi:hypothetical protein DPMN_149477 [Dreissena polymorpha]|uniref:Uncharacterized protein n=1 Tax=Dreissena polymorpha TaxID=45954 RepID=A0A9D4FG17_DREPO|nr:hypothetical protein DPMN_149477 [Dreissena polymorpha]